MKIIGKTLLTLLLAAMLAAVALAVPSPHVGEEAADRYMEMSMGQ